MKISPINQNPNIKFKSKIKKVISGALTKSIADSVDIFEETHKNAKKLGSGLFATAYVLEPSGFVIKESLADNHAKAQNGCFYHEAKALAMIPPKMKQTQKLVALAQTEKDNYYLISTFIQGKSVRYPERPWSPHSFQSLFNVMFALDKEGIYHNDINQGNCLIDNRAEVNIIDYQFAEKFKIDDTRKNDKEFKTPYFMMPSNAQMFEMASLPWYFLSMEKTAKKQEIHDCFKTYLDIKSSYAQKRADYLASLGSNPQKTEYESLQAKFFKNPSEDMINLQAKKLQILYSFRKTFSIIDNNSKNDKNIASAVSSYINTAACAKEMAIQAERMKKNSQDEELNTFLDYEISFADYWQNTMLNELTENNDNSVFDWVERNAQLSPKHKIETVVQYDDDFGEFEDTVDMGIPKGEDLSEKFKSAENLDFGSIPNIADIICLSENNSSKSQTKNGYCENSIHELAQELTQQIKEPEQKEFDETLSDYTAKKQKFLAAGRKTILATKKNLYNAAIANAIMAEYLGSIAIKALKELPSEYADNKAFIEKETALLNINLCKEIAHKSAQLLIKNIRSSHENEQLLPNINIFDVKED